VSTQVDAVLAAAGPALADRMARVEERLAGAAGADGGALSEHARATIAGAR